MKLTIEKHPEFDRLSRYFLKIELLADKLGVKVDDLIKTDHAVKGEILYPEFKTEQQRLSEERKNIFRVVR